MSELDLVQVEALRFARGKPGVGYFLEMGLGKTLLALEEFKRVDATRLVVVAPNSFKQGWRDEIEKHGFDFDAHIFVSSTPKANEKWFSHRYTKPAVLIINYEAIRSPTVLLRLIAWMRIKPAMLVLDESIQIKTHDSAQTRAALTLSKEAKIVRILTGLPQTQGAHDLYPQLRAIGLFQTQKFWAFRNWFCEMGGWENKQIIGVKHADELARAMAPVVFQAKKADWLPSLPRKDFTIRQYEMSGEQRAQYIQMERDFVLDMERIETANSDDVVTVRVAVSKYEKLSQIQCGMVIDNDKAVQELVEPAKNPRLNLLLDIVEQIEGKVIVIYRHKAVFDLLYLHGGFDAPAYIKGQMTPDEVGAQKERFNNDPACRVLLGQCQATRYGHTLIAGPEPINRASTMIFFENDYSLDTRTQIEDRIHRRGQTAENCLYIDLAGTELDRRVAKALQKKQDLYQAVFSKLRRAIPNDEIQIQVG